MVPMAPPVDIPAGSVLKSALAGGLASALSTSMLHPLDTVKVRLLHRCPVLLVTQKIAPFELMTKRRLNFDDTVTSFCLNADL